MLLSLDLCHGERSAGWRGYSWTPTFMWMSAVLEAQPRAMLGGQNKAGPKTWKGPCNFSEHLGMFRFGIRPRSSWKSIIRCCKKRGLIVIGFGCGGWTWRRGQDWQTEPAPPRAQGSNPSRSSGCCCCLDYWEIKLCFWANGIMQLGQGTAHQPLSFKGLVGNGKEAQKKPLPGPEPAWPSLAVPEGHRGAPGLARTDLGTGVREEVGAEESFSKAMTVNGVEMMSRD